MTPELLKRLIVRPVLAEMGPAFDSLSATRLLTAIAIQESDLRNREQYPTGPALSWWQAERVGVNGVFVNKSTARILRAWCSDLVVPFYLDAIYRSIEYNDQMACVVARLILYADPAPLPADEAGGWNYYLRCWRPGKPRPKDWSHSWVTSA